MNFLARLLNRTKASGTGASAGDDDLFDEDFIRRVETLALASRKAASGLSRGERRRKKKGSGVEFADHRSYVPGDDIRFVDTSVYQRFGKLLVRVYEEEEDLSVYLLLDASGSMGRARSAAGSLETGARSKGGAAGSLETGARSKGGAADSLDSGARSDRGQTKLRQAKLLLGALGYIALSSLDRVSAIGLRGDGWDKLPPIRGKQRIFSLLRFLKKQRAEGPTDLGAQLRTFVAAHPRRGLCILASDLFDPAGFEVGINQLRFNKFEVAVLHLVSADDAEVEPAGDVRLLDTETGEGMDVTVTEALLERTRAAHQERGAAVARFCAARGVPYFEVDPDAPFDEVVLGVLRRGGLFR